MTPPSDEMWGLIERRIANRWRVHRAIEQDPFAKKWPEGAKGHFAILGYREQGFAIALQPSGQRAGSGEWGDEVVQYSDGTFGVLPSRSILNRILSDHLKGPDND